MAIRLIPEGKGINFLPNLITSGALLAGFYSVMSAINGDFVVAAWAIVVAGVLDILDGRVARMTGTMSDFGVAYDSLCDFFNFGFAPAMLAYFWLLQPYGKWGWAGAFIWVACAALRLARYNVQAEEAEEEGETITHFFGLPTPPAAYLIVTAVLAHQVFVETGRLENWPLGIIMMVIVYGGAFLMVSSIRFRTFKDFDFKEFGPFKLLLIAMGIAAAAIAQPEVTVFAGAYTYLGLGLFDFVKTANEKQRIKLAEKKEAKKAA